MLKYKYACLEYIEGSHYAVLSKFFMHDLGYSNNFKLRTILEITLIYKDKVIDGVEGNYEQEYLNENQTSLPYLKIKGKGLTEGDSIICLRRTDDLSLCYNLTSEKDLEDVAISSKLKSNIVKETERTKDYIEGIYKTIKKENDCAIPYRHYYKSLVGLIDTWLTQGQVSFELLQEFGKASDYKYYTTAFSHIKASTRYTLKAKGMLIKKHNPLKTKLEVEESKNTNKFKYHVNADYITWFYRFLQEDYSSDNNILFFSLYDIIQDLVQYIRTCMNFDVDLIISLLSKASVKINRRVYESKLALSDVDINSIHAPIVLKNYRNTGFLLDYANTENLNDKIMQLYKDIAKYNLLNKKDISVTVDLTGGLKIRAFKINSI